MYYIVRKCKVLTRLAATGREWVSYVTLRTAADWVVTDNVTLGVNTAHSHTWVGTLEVDTGKCWGTFTVNHTLRSACRRGAIVARVAGTHRAGLNNSALGIWSTRRWLARISRFWGINNSRNQRALGKWISSVTLVTFTNGIVI